MLPCSLAHQKRVQEKRDWTDGSEREERKEARREQESKRQLAALPYDGRCVAQITRLWFWEGEPERCTCHRKETQNETGGRICGERPKKEHTHPAGAVRQTHLVRARGYRVVDWFAFPVSVVMIPREVVMLVGKYRRAFQQTRRFLPSTAIYLHTSKRRSLSSFLGTKNKGLLLCLPRLTKPAGGGALCLPYIYIAHVV